MALVALAGTVPLDDDIEAVFADVDLSLVLCPLPKSARGNEKRKKSDTSSGDDENNKLAKSIFRADRKKNQKDIVKSLQARLRSLRAQQGEPSKGNEGSGMGSGSKGRGKPTPVPAVL